MLPGVKIHDLKRNTDERGFFSELFREDWKEFIGNDRIVQVNMSLSHPGVIRAWHRHSRGQTDYFCVVDGEAEIGVYDGTEGSKTKGQSDRIRLSSEKPQILRVPGHYWHGTKCIGKKPSLSIYLVTKLYDAKNPDEERMPHDSKETKYKW